MSSGSRGCSMPRAAARFQTLSGTLTVVRRGGWLDMDFPTRPVEPAAAPPGLAEALGEDAVFVGRTANDYVVELRSADAVRNLRPDLASLERVEARGIAVTAPSDDARYDFVSRFFAPRSGIPEDPSPARRTAPSGPTGRRSSARTNSPATRPRAGAARCASGPDPSAPSSAGKPSPRRWERLRRTAMPR